MVLFRTDGNDKIGLGHVMRCLSTATALRDKSFDVMFACADNYCEKIITQNGFRYTVLNSSYDNLDIEIEQIIHLVNDFQINIIFVDSYFVTSTFFKAISKLTRVVYIDDILKFPYQVDVLINYNIFSSNDAYRSLYKNSLKMPVFLLGTDYLPLRKEFSFCRIKAPNKKVKNVLVLTGGGDPEHVGIRFLAHIYEMQEFFADLYFYFVIGLANKDYDIMQRIATKMPNVFLLQNVRKMCKLMTACDLAVSASGSTLYELAVTGVPTISYVIAMNQKNIADSFESKGITKNIGYINNDNSFVSSVFQALTELTNNYTIRKEMAYKGYKEINKNGSNNIVEQLIRLI